MINTNWKFYTETEKAWEDMLEACKKAQRSINLEMYGVGGEIWQRFLTVLTEKKKQGVSIKILCDMVGSYTFYNSPLPDELRQQGLEIHFFNVINPWRIHNFSSWYFRDHRKILIIDKAVGFTGGVNIRDDHKTWRDTHVRVEGTIVEEMTRAFDDMWKQSTEKNPLLRLRYAKRYTKGFNFLINAPYIGKQFIYHALIDAIKSAKKYIYLTSPYFIPTIHFIRALRSARARGVDVRILLPGHIEESRWITRASCSWYTLLLKIGVRIYHYQSSHIHAKTAVIDGEWASVGSLNLDHLSFTYNHEANIVSNDKTFVETLHGHFIDDITHAQEITQEIWKQRPLLEKLEEFLVLPFREFM